MLQRLVHLRLVCSLLILSVVSAAAQGPPEADTQAQEPPPHDHAAMLAAAAGRWQFMWDGAMFTTFNYQGGSRGDRDFRAQNWLMVMGSRQLGRGTLQLSAMASLEPVTVGAAGYAHIFQLGEAYQNLPVTDRQHPHDLFMQLDAGWRVAIGKTALSLSGGPVGAPRLARLRSLSFSASENPVAPLTHHTFDSTHIAMGTMTTGVRRGALRARSIRVSWPRARRVSLRPRHRGTRFGVGAASPVAARTRLGIPALARLYPSARDAGAGQPETHERVRVVAAERVQTARSPQSRS